MSLWCVNSRVIIRGQMNNVGANNINFMYPECNINTVNDSDYISVMTGTVVLWCDGLLQESESTGKQQEQRQSPEESGM